MHLRFALFVFITTLCSIGVAQTPPQTQTELSARSLERILAAEIALQRNQYSEAWNGFMTAAKLTGDARLAEDAWSTAAEADDPRAARVALNLWLELDPSSLSARFYDTQNHLAAGEYDYALDKYTELFSDADTSTVLDLLEQVLDIGMQDENKQAFYSFFQKLAHHYSLKDARVCLQLAKAANAANDKNGALAYALRALELAPENPAILLEGADYEFQNTPHAAATRLKNFLTRHPKNMQVQLAYAKALIRVGPPSALLEQIKLIDRTDPHNPHTQFVLGMIAEEAGLYERAELHYARFLVIAAKTPDERLNSDAGYVRMGMVKLAQGQPHSAVQWLHKVEKGDKYIPARLKEAELLAAMNRVDEACDVLKNIRTESPDQKLDMCRACADLLIRAHRRSDAVELLLGVLEKDRNNHELTYQTAMIAEQAGLIDTAERLLQRYILLQPQDANGYNALGYMRLIERSDPSEAAELIQTAMNLSGGEDPFIIDSMGWLRYRQDRLVEAEAHLRKARRLKNDPEITLHLAQVLFARGKRIEAEELVRSVLAKDPKNTDALSILKANNIRY